MSDDDDESLKTPEEQMEEAEFKAEMHADALRQEAYMGGEL
jgi:hypothetical protein